MKAEYRIVKAKGTPPDREMFRVQTRNHHSGWDYVPGRWDHVSYAKQAIQNMKAIAALFKEPEVVYEE